MHHSPLWQVNKMEALKKITVELKEEVKSLRRKVVGLERARKRLRRTIESDDDEEDIEFTEGEEENVSPRPKRKKKGKVQRVVKDGEVPDVNDEEIQIDYTLSTGEVKYHVKDGPYVVYFSDGAAHKIRWLKQKEQPGKSTSLWQYCDWPGQEVAAHHRCQLDCNYNGTDTGVSEWLCTNGSKFEIEPVLYEYDEMLYHDYSPLLMFIMDSIDSRDMTRQTKTEYRMNFLEIAQLCYKEDFLRFGGNSEPDRESDQELLALLCENSAKNIDQQLFKIPPRVTVCDACNRRRVVCWNFMHLNICDACAEKMRNIARLSDAVRPKSSKLSAGMAFNVFMCAFLDLKQVLVD